MGTNEEESNLTKAVPLNVGETGMLSLVTDSETGEIVAIDSSSLLQLPAGEAFLVVRRGTLEGTKFALSNSQKMSIGRTADSGIFLDDVTVSRKHATVELLGNSWTLTDEGSLNGTYVNKHRVVKSSLVNGDEVQIGKFRFVFALASSAGE
jgi:pSer/pThr/pTyr-binding forkhead associated (FHA) protein